jgi:PadR family transcriptional regulator PadR
MKNLIMTSMQYSKSLPRIDFKINQMEYIVLNALIYKELYGLQIEEAVNKGSEGQFNVTVGSLYPILQKLEDNGLLESRWGDKRPEERGRARRRFYKLTALGSSVIEKYENSVNGIRQWQPA